MEKYIVKFLEGGYKVKLPLRFHLGIQIKHFQVGKKKKTKRNKSKT